MKKCPQYRSLLVGAIAGVTIAFSAATAATTLSFTMLSYASEPGAISPTDSRPLAATAIFTFDDTCTADCSLILELANTETMTGISQGLTDFHFASSSLLTLAGADGQSFADCTATNVNFPQCTFTDAAFDPASYGWTLTGLGVYTLAATPLPHNGIVSSAIPDASSDGVSNPQHNPWLVGPVDFSFTYSGLFNVDHIAFSFGTDARLPTIPGCIVNCGSGDPTVPEPAPLALLGIAALAYACSRRSKALAR